MLVFILGSGLQFERSLRNPAARVRFLGTYWTLLPATLHPQPDVFLNPFIHFLFFWGGASNEVSWFDNHTWQSKPKCKPLNPKQ